MKLEGITVVSPMWGERKVTDRMVFSVIHQYLGKDDPIHIELVLVDDYIEGRGEKNESPYDWYVSDEFKKLFCGDEHISIKLIKNKTHKYQGESREIGFLAGKYDWFILVDCDDMLAPNACDRYRHIINSYYEKDPQYLNDKKELACVHGYLYSFGEHGYEHNIIGESIWVQSRCYNRVFVKENEIHFPTGTNSRQGEDYPFIRKFDYAMHHNNKTWTSVKVPYNNNCDCQATAFWFPNDNSLSRKDPHYSHHLAGWTMASSNSILDYFMAFNKKHNIEDQEDEAMKHEVLNMTIYAFYNLLDFLKEVASTDYKPLKEDWDMLRKSVALLRSKLKDGFWDEIIYSDIEDMLYRVKHYSDVHFCESWFGTFYDFMNKGFFAKVKNGNKKNILDLTHQEMIDYCHTLKFDGANHEIHSKQVKAWAKRHNVKNFDK